MYDVIVSRAVLEHLYDPFLGLESMVLCLKPRGRMIQKIDLRDHGLFTPHCHEDTFLGLSNVFYRCMTKFSGRPNRVLLHQYREKLENLMGKISLEYSVFVTRLAGVGDLTPHQLYADISEEMWSKAIRYVDSQRQHFAEEFRDVNSKDLAVAGIF